MDREGMVMFLSINIPPRALTHVLRFSMAYTVFSDKTALGPADFRFLDF